MKRRTIVVGLDESQAAAEAVRWAARQSQLTGDRLLALHVFRVDAEPSDPASVRTTTESVRRALATRWLRGALDDCPAFPYSLRLEVVEGRWPDPLSCLPTDSTSLVVLGASRRARPPTLLLPLVLVPAPTSRDDSEGAEDGETHPARPDSPRLVRSPA